MILEFLVLLTVALFTLSWFEIIHISYWIVMIPIALAYIIRTILIIYDRLSASRWEEYQRVLSLERAGVREFKDVMIGTIVAMLRRTPVSSEPAEDIDVENPLPPDYVPPGYDDEEKE